jgi:hypothetical protein
MIKSVIFLTYIWGIIFTLVFNMVKNKESSSENLVYTLLWPWAIWKGYFNR